MAGYYLVCPTDSTLSFDSGERARCRLPDGTSGWEIHHTDELTDQLALVLTELFTLPSIENLGQVFAVVVTTIMGAYMAAWACGQLLSMFNSKEDRDG